VPRIDAHQHFWRYDAVEYGWIDESMAGLRRDFLPADAEREMRRGGFDACVAVQARRVEGVDGFIEALESQGTFKNVLPAEEQTNEDGLIEAVLDGVYLAESQPPAAVEPVPEPPAEPSPPRASAGATPSHD